MCVHVSFFLFSVREKIASTFSCVPLLLFLLFFVFHCRFIRTRLYQQINGSRSFARSSAACSLCWYQFLAAFNMNPPKINKRRNFYFCFSCSAAAAAVWVFSWTFVNSIDDKWQSSHTQYTHLQKQEKRKMCDTYNTQTCNTSLHALAHAHIYVRVCALPQNAAKIDLAASKILFATKTISCVCVRMCRRVSVCVLLTICHSIYLNVCNTI